MAIARVSIESEDETLFIIVAAPTGVIYEHQCGGYSCDQRSLEGFVVQVGDEKSPGIIYDWFWKRFEGTCANSNVWNDVLISELEQLIAGVCCFYLRPDGRDWLGDLQYLKLDRERMAECVEAWIPVLSPYGPAILVLGNSD